jgi:hypothetical protein
MRGAVGHDLFSNGSLKEQAAWAEIALLRDTAKSSCCLLELLSGVTCLLYAVKSEYIDYRRGQCRSLFRKDR